MNEEIKITCDNDVMKYSPDQIYDYIYKLQNNWNELKRLIEEKIDVNRYTMSIINDPIKTSLISCENDGLRYSLSKMQELEQEKDDK